MEPFCSFCDKGRSGVRVLIEGLRLTEEEPPRAHICDKCVVLAAELLVGEHGICIDTTSHTGKGEA